MGCRPGLWLRGRRGKLLQRGRLEVSMAAPAAAITVGLTNVQCQCRLQPPLVQVNLTVWTVVYVQRWSYTKNQLSQRTPPADIRSPMHRLRAAPRSHADTGICAAAQSAAAR